jgi:tetratricopeptide (TPR) repeat protein
MMSRSDPVHEYCSHGWNEYREGRVGQALAAFRHALALDQSSLPARFGLASMLLDHGDVVGAAQVVARVVPSFADRPEMLWLRARIAMAQGALSDACAFADRLLADPRLDEAQRAEAILLRGLAQGDLGQFGKAFSAALEGKRMLRSAHAAHAAGREGEVVKLRRVARWIADTPAASSSAPRASSAARTHVFLLGFPRSGTTLLEQVLAAHPRVDTLEEAPTLSAAYQAFLSDPNACARLANLGREEATAWVDHYWDTIRGHGIASADRVFIDKQPAGTVHLPIIAALFPTAKIVFAIRDPRDVVLSCFRQAFQMNAMTYSFTDLRETAACYDACMRLAETARARYPLAWTDVRHEALVDGFDAELARILDFLELENDPAMRDFARAANARAIRTPSATQVRAGINRRGFGRWRQYERELASILPIVAPWIERFGYVP